MSWKAPREKTSEKCGRTLPEKDFGIIPTGQNWKSNWCQECRTEKYNEDHKEE